MKKTAVMFPGQGSQAPGMAKELFETNELARERFYFANEILEFEITDVMFEGTAEELMKTSVTQPAIFLHSVILAEALDVKAYAAYGCGHSLGEFSALTAAGALRFDVGLKLVAARAQAMQKACDLQESTMAAIIGVEDEMVESICEVVQSGVVVPANYNAPNQLVISGATAAVEEAVELAKSKGAKKAIVLAVNGAFHSPLMQPAQDELSEAIDAAEFSEPAFPIYHNATAKPAASIDEMRENLKKQLTSPVRWTQTIRNLAAEGAESFEEIGPGKALQGLVKRVDRALETSGQDTVVYQWTT